MNNKKTMKDRFKIMYKYFYIILLFMILCGSLTLYYVSNQPGYFESKSIILISNENFKNNIEAKTFVTHLKTRDVLMTVNENLNLEYSYEKLLKMINIKIISGTKLIEISTKTSNGKHSKNIIDNLIQVFTEKMTDFYPNENLKIVENPITTNKANYMNQNLYTGIGTGLGFIIGTILVLMFGSIDVNIKNHEDLKKYLKMKSLGVIPDNNIDDENTGKKKKKGHQSNITIVDNPSSIISESFRMIRTNLDFLDLKVINITSTTAGEGKSGIITNVGLAFAMIGKKVLIIDCDLRKPVIHKIFSLNRTLGLTDIILYNRINEANEMIQEYKIPNSEHKIDVLSAGSKIYNPSELLNSNRFVKLIDKLKEDYDLILIDCPPISLMTDAVIVSKITDGTAYVIEYNRINCAAIQSCIEQLNDVNATVLGGIVNKVNIKKQKKLYGNKYDYYYNNYM